MVALALGLRFAYVRLGAEDEHGAVVWTEGQTEAEGFCDTQIAHAKEWVAAGYGTVAMAGPVAECLVFGGLEMPSLIGASNDMHQAVAWISAALPPDEHVTALEDACARAEELLIARRPALDAVAALLETQERVTYDEVRRLSC